MDGRKDENVFDIQQGVSIAFFVRFSDHQTNKIYRKDLLGNRQSKYNYLPSKKVYSIQWIKVELIDENYNSLGQGWIKWREEGKLLISYSLLS